MTSKSQTRKSSKEQPGHRQLTRRSYKQLVISAIQNLKEKAGSTEKSIRNYLIRESDVKDDDGKSLLNIKLAIKECIGEGSLKKGKSGIFQLVVSPCKKDELKKKSKKKKKGKSKKKKGKSKKRKKGKSRKRKKGKSKKKGKKKGRCSKRKKSSKKKRKSSKKKKKSNKGKTKSGCAPRPKRKKR